MSVCDCQQLNDKEQAMLEERIKRASKVVKAPAASQQPAKVSPEERPSTATKPAASAA